jgi:hypothetical protein
MAFFLTQKEVFPNQADTVLLESVSVGVSVLTDTKVRPYILAKIFVKKSLEVRLLGTFLGIRIRKDAYFLVLAPRFENNILG